MYDAVQTPSASICSRRWSCSHTMRYERLRLACGTRLATIGQVRYFHDPLNEDKLACCFRHASKNKKEICRHSEVSEGIALTVPRTSFGWDEIRLAVGQRRQRTMLLSGSWPSHKKDSTALNMRELHSGTSQLAPTQSDSGQHGEIFLKKSKMLNPIL